MNPFSPIISDRLHIPASQVQATLALLKAGCTIPFISRYRKEATGNLNEVQITAINDLDTQLDEVQKRKENHSENHRGTGQAHRRTAPSHRSLMGCNRA